MSLIMYRVYASLQDCQADPGGVGQEPPTAHTLAHHRLVQCGQLIFQTFFRYRCATEGGRCSAGYCYRPSQRTILEQSANQERNDV